MTPASKSTGGSARPRSLPIQTPPWQNWSCHGCTVCCRGHLAIEISAAEKALIESQGWTQADGVDPDTMIVARGGRFHLGHQSDGACVFLDTAGRCRIHARFGEPAKPLACRLYPFAIHPAGKKLVVSLRYDCPSAVANRGTPLTDQVTALRGLAEQIVPADFEGGEPPPVLRDPARNWADLLRYVGYLDKIVATGEGPVALKVLRAIHWIKAIEQAQFDRLSGAEADEILGALWQSAAKKLPAMEGASVAPSRFGRLLFRTLVFEYAQPGTGDGRRSGDRGWWRRLWGLARYARGAGNVPSRAPHPVRVAFSSVEQPFGPLPAEAEALLTRFLRVKIHGLHFCGRAYYEAPLIEGFHSLSLLFAAILWLSRRQAAGDGRSRLTIADVSQAVGMADHYHGYSKRLGSRGARRRVRLLAERDDIAALCWWYSR